MRASNPTLVVHFRVAQKSGAEALVASFAALVEGRADPEQALLHSL